jgi:hypothetical protein
VGACAAGARWHGEAYHEDMAVTSQALSTMSLLLGQ